ncbi:hypothetical protein ACROYT_G005244 [Oculina patagonica]
MLAPHCSGFSITGERHERSVVEDDEDWARSQQEAANLSASINEILGSYDRKLRPNAGGEPVEVTVEIKVVSFGELNEANMEYSLDIFFRQWWYDPRFRHNSSTPFNIAADPSLLFWTPDTYFFNVKRIKYHYVTRENMRVMIHSTGKIYYSARITLTAQCDMDFRMYPMDTQHCPLIIESYAHTTDDMYYKWRRTKENERKGIETVSKEMAQFELVGIETKTKDTKNSKGSFASLTVVFSFKRRMEYFVSTVFSPAVTLVVLSWCCFWISRHAVPARVSLGITTILTAIVLFGSVNETMPPVSYSKAQDYFLLVSFGFIFVSFLEFVIVLHTDPDPGWLRWLRSCCQANSNKEEKKPLKFEEAVLEKESSSYTSTEPDTELEAEIILPSETVFTAVNSHVRPCSHTLPRRVVVSNGEQGATVMLLDKSGEMRHRNIQVKATNQESRKKRKSYSPHWVDMISRIIFPGSYVAFLVLFWRQFVQQVPL